MEQDYQKQALLAFHDPATEIMYKLTLESKGFSVSILRNTLELIEYLASGQNLDVLLMDVNLGHIGGHTIQPGFDVYEKLQSQAQAPYFAAITGDQVLVDQANFAGIPTWNKADWKNLLTEIP